MNPNTKKILAMTAFDLVFMMRDFMKRMSNFDIKMNDYKHIDMFQEYKRLEGQGAKKEYIKAELSHKYGISESTVNRIIRRLDKTFKN